MLLFGASLLFSPWPSRAVGVFSLKLVSREKRSSKSICHGLCLSARWMSASCQKNDASLRHMVERSSPRGTVLISVAVASFWHNITMSTKNSPWTFIFCILEISIHVVGVVFGDGFVFFFFSSKYPGCHYWSAAYPFSEIMGLKLEAEPGKGWALANQAEHSSHSCKAYLDALSWWPQVSCAVSPDLHCTMWHWNMINTLFYGVIFPWWEG